MAASSASAGRSVVSAGFAASGSGAEEGQSQTPASPSNPNLRFVDYFFQAGIHPTTDLLACRVKDEEEMEQESSGRVLKESTTTPSRSRSVSLQQQLQAKASPAPSIHSSGADGLKPHGDHARQASKTSIAESISESLLQGKWPIKLDFSLNFNIDILQDSPVEPTPKQEIPAVPHSRSNISMETSGTPCTSRMNRKHPIEYKYDPTILSRYPQNDYSEEDKLPLYTSKFCFPNLLSFKHDTSGQPSSEFHTFIATDGIGVKSYGVCVTVYEKLSPELQTQVESMFDKWKSECIATSDIEYIQHMQRQLAQNQEAILKARNGIIDPKHMDSTLEDIIAEAEERVEFYKTALIPFSRTVLVDPEQLYCPRSIGLISHWPMYDVLFDWLRELLKVASNDYGPLANRLPLTYAPIERYMINLFHEVPIPPPGRLELKLSIGQLSLYCSRPPVNSIGALQNFSFYPLFRCMSIANILTIFELALVEKQIIFTSSYNSMLTMACEALLLFMYPLSWYHMFIPVLPQPLLSYLEAPFPYIVGVNKEYFTDSVLEQWCPQEATIVDLDNNVLNCPKLPPMIPAKDRRKLVIRLFKYCGLPAPTGSNLNLAQKDNLPGVPITMKYAYPKGMLITKSTVSRRWLHSEAESLATAASPKSATSAMVGSAVSARPRKGDEPKGSNEQLKRHSMLQQGGGDVAGFFGKLQRNESVLTEDTSHGSLPSNDTYRTLPTGDSFAAEEARDSFDSSRPVTLDRKTPAHKRNRTKSTDYSDPADLPPLAPLVISGDTGGDQYTGLPTGRLSTDLLEEELMSYGGSYDELDSAHHLQTSASVDELNDKVKKEKSGGINFANFFSFGGTSPTRSQSSSPTKPTADYAVSINDDNSSLFSSRVSHRPSYAPSMMTASVYTHDVDSEYPHSDDTQSPSPTGPHGPNLPARDIIRLEGHQFISVSLETLNTQAEVTPPSAHGSQSSLNQNDNPTITRGVGSRRSLFTHSQSSLHDAQTNDSNLLSVARGATSRSSISLSPSRSMRQSRNFGGASAFMNSLERRVSQMSVLKGGSERADVIIKPSELLCRLCCEKFTEEGENLPHKCQTCRLTVHKKCLDCVEGYPCASIFNEKKIQGSFFKVFTSLFKNYRNYLIVPDTLKKAIQSGLATDSALLDLVPDKWFKTEEFVASLDRDSKLFFNQFVVTQAFSQFTLERVERPESDYEILFFDESIKAKLNRSRLKFTKETTPFLKDSAYGIRSTVTIVTPNIEGIDSRSNYSTPSFPYHLKENLIIAPRVIAPLITESDQRMMRSHTNDLVNKARMATGLKRKQDFTKWMRTKLNHFRKIGGGEVVSIGFLSDEQRRELFEERVRDVSEVIEKYQANHLSAQTAEEIKAAMLDLEAQHLVLMQAAEEDLVDAADQKDLSVIYSRLFDTIQIYQDHLLSLDSSYTPGQATNQPPASYHHPLKNIVSEINKDIQAIGLGQKVRSVWKRVDKEVSILSLPTAVRSRSASLRKKNGEPTAPTQPSLSHVIVHRDLLLSNRNSKSSLEVTRIRSRSGTIPKTNSQSILTKLVAEDSKSATSTDEEDNRPLGPPNSTLKSITSPNQSDASLDVQPSKPHVFRQSSSSAGLTVSGPTVKARSASLQPPSSSAVSPPVTNFPATPPLAPLSNTPPISSPNSTREPISQPLFGAPRSTSVPSLDLERLAAATRAILPEQGVKAVLMSQSNNSAQGGGGTAMDFGKLVASTKAELEGRLSKSGSKHGSLHGSRDRLNLQLQ